MVFIEMKVKIKSDYIENVFVPDSSFKWCFRVTCGHCKEDGQNEIYFTEEDEVEIKGSRGCAHFVMSCK